jgi:hypothetical protein
MAIVDGIVIVGPIVVIVPLGGPVIQGRGGCCRSEREVLLD